MCYYHYTKGCHLPSIVRDGIIRTTHTLCERRERPAAWLTRSPQWESFCNIGVVVNAKELVPGQLYAPDEIDSVTVSDDYMKKRIGMCRILISESLPTVSWAKFKHVGRISERMYGAIDEYARSIGCPVGKWSCTFNPIPKKYWEGIEMYVQDEWVKWDEKMPIEEFVQLCISCNNI